LAVGITNVGNKRKEARVYCCKKKWKLFLFSLFILNPKKKRNWIQDIWCELSFSFRVQIYTTDKNP
jgi:hypothetical protein